MSPHPETARFSLPFLNGSIRVGAQDTGNGFALLEMNMKPFAGPDAHIHLNEEEFFYVLDGEYEFSCGADTFVCGPGEVVMVPRGVPHRLVAGAQGGRHLTLFAPAGPEGWFVEANSLARADALNPETARELFEKYGMTVVGDVKTVG